MDEQNDKKIQVLEEENHRLRASITELSVLNEIATAIRSTQTLELIINLIIQKCIKHLHVEQGVILLLDQNEEEQIFRTMIRKAEQSAQFLPYRLDSQLLGWMIKNKKAMIINDCKNDAKFGSSSDENLKMKSILAVPLVSRNELIGLIAMFNKHDPEEFDEGDQRLLSIVATQSAQIIENARLFEEERQLLRMREEMRFAKDIQDKLLPESAPVLKGYDIAGRTLPAKEIGGDYYDFIPLSEGKMAFCLGDVSGKGLPAAMLMANLQATLRGQAMLKNTPEQCMYYSNVLLHASTSSEKFATLFYGILDAEKNEITFSNAGHDNPFLFLADKRIIRLQKGGIVLGFMDKFDYTQDSFGMNIGDVLLIYSDGISEAMNSDEEEFSEQRLENLAPTLTGLNAKTMIDRMYTEIQDHAGDTAQMDDMTMIIIKRVS